jgi:PAS domain S-box-containing protein
MNPPERDADRVGRQLAALQARLDGLRRSAGDGEPRELLEAALAELSVTVEELRVAEEELHQQADELQASYTLLEAERQRYADLFEFAPDGYLVTDSQGVIREVNWAAAVLLGRPPERLLGKPLPMFMTPETAPALRHHLAEVTRTGERQVWDGSVVRDGRTLNIECTVAIRQVPGDHAPAELRWHLHDITDRMQAEDAVRSSRQSLRELSARLEAVREEERANIARAVHDEIGAALTAIKMDVAQVQRGLDRLEAEHDVEALCERTQAASSLIDNTMQTVRRIAMELRPSILDDFGLVAALDWQLNEFQKRSGLVCNLNVAPGNGQLPPETATTVFRIFQEILTNVARHAHASQVDVRLYQEGRMVVLDVRDNGRGIRVDEAEGVGTLGLLGMRERARMQGGTLEVKGTPGQGTRVRVLVPVGSGAQEQPLALS